MLKIVQDYYRDVIGRIAEAATKPGGEQVVERAKQAVIEAKLQAIRGKKPH